MTIAVKRAAETYPEVARDLDIDVDEVKEDSIKLLKDTYIYDGTTGGTKKQVNRMLGFKMEDGSYSGTFPRMMQKVGLRLKTIVTSKSSEMNISVPDEENLFVDHPVPEQFKTVWDGTQFKTEMVDIN